MTIYLMTVLIIVSRLDLRDVPPVPLTLTVTKVYTQRRTMQDLDLLVFTLRGHDLLQIQLITVLHFRSRFIQRTSSRHRLL